MSDVYFPVGKICHKKDRKKMKMVIKVNETCWKNIHPHELDVFDFTFWASDAMGAHPGNFITRNPIKEFAQAGEYQLKFPRWHNMERWYSNKNKKIQWIGRFGDVVTFKDLPEVLKRDVSAISSELSNYSDLSDSAIICGSPGEVSNDYPLVDAFDEIDRSGFGKPYGYFHEKYFRQRKIVWTEVALKAPDQLRQRTAW